MIHITDTTVLNDREIIVLAGRAVTGDRVLTLVSRADRSQAKNRESARARLLALLRRVSTPPTRLVRS
jgi:hypothetical protein